MIGRNQVRILLHADKEQILEFASAEALAELDRLGSSDPMEREMITWEARWRPEALDHYLPLGWSYGVFDDQGQVLGFLLAQPLLFYRGLTQTVWVERLMVRNGDPAVGRTLLDTAYRWARDKHVQCLLFESEPDLKRWLEGLDFATRASQVSAPLIELRSSRYGANH